MPFNSRFLPYVAALCVFAGVVFITTVVVDLEKQKQALAVRADMIRHVSGYLSRIEASFNKRLFLTRSISNYIATHRDLSDWQLQSLAHLVIGIDPAIKEIRLTRVHKAPLVFLSPFSSAPVGSNYVLESRIEESAAKAEATGKTVFAGPFKSSEGSQVLLLQTPVRLEEGSATNEAGALWGFVQVILDAPRFFEEVDLQEETTVGRFAIRFNDPDSNVSTVLFGDPRIFKLDAISLDMRLPLGTLQLAAVPHGGWSGNPSSVRWLVITGIAFATFLSIITWLFAQTPQRLSRLVMERTAELRSSQKELQEARDELENRVQQRTAELTDVNERLRMEIAERGKTQHKLAQSEEKYRTIIENIEEGYYEVDLKGNLVFCNDPLCRMYGLPKEELIGLNYRQVCDEETAKYLNSVFSDVFKTNTPRASITFTILRKDGSPRTLEASVAIVRDMNQKATGFRGICRDVTEKKYTEELLLRSERLKAVGELASGVAHNFNNLLQIIMGGAQLAKSNLQSGNLEAVSLRLDQLFQSARLGSETVRRLQTFARLKSDFAREGNVFDLSETVRSAVEMSSVWWKSTPEKNGINIELHDTLQEGCTVFGRENELFEVVVNLIKNAVEAMPKGGTISIATGACEEEVCLVIQDTGIGIPPQHLKRIFEPFFTTGGLQRTGMGLASTYGIISEHGGEITVQSQVGKGTIFTIKLPRAVPLEPTEQTINPDPKFRNLTFLIVDDLEYVVNLLTEALTPFSRKVFGAYSGEQALELFCKNPTDIILCDLGMPKMSGWEVGKRIREYCEEQGLKKPFFVVLTGWGGQDEETQKIAESGVDAVIEKPVDINILVQLIHEHMERPVDA